MDRRNNLDIFAEILRLAEKGARKSHIVYAANLNHASLERYLNSLEEQGLIARNVKVGKQVRTTEKGLLFVQQYKDLLKIGGL